MRSGRIVLLIPMLVLAACAGNSQPPQGNSFSSPSSGGSGKSGAYSAPIPPKDAQWTLHCVALTGPMRVEETNRLRDRVVQATGLREWYIIHSETESSLYYGYYRSIGDSRDPDTARARADRQRIAALQMPPGERPFERALFVEITTGDPPAPPEWNILNKDRDKPDSDPTKAYWTIEIASFVDTPERKQAAVDAVREARAQGVEAYFYHGRTISSVLIGTWPRSAVKEQEMGVAQTDAFNQDQTIVLLPSLPPGAMDKLKLPENAKVLAPKVEPQDPTLLEMMRRYPDHYVNNQRRLRKVKDPNTGVEKKVAEDSVLVEIPRDQKPVGSGYTQPAPTAANPVTPPPQNDPYAAPGNTPVMVRPADRPAGTGRLRSIGE